MVGIAGASSLKNSLLKLIFRVNLSLLQQSSKNRSNNTFN
jgi:hypothetical protein